MAKLSIYGLYQYDNTVFDDLPMPGDLDRETFVDNLMLECSEFSCIYTNPSFMKSAITAWGKQRIRVWQDLFDTTQYEYNPIWNKDGKITETVVEDRDYKEHTNGNASESSSHQAENTDGVSAFNSGAFANSEHTVLTEQSGRGSEAENDTSGQDDKTTVLERVEQGNIGITSTQALIQEQRDIVQMDIYKIMIDEFKNRFCVLCYAI